MSSTIQPPNRKRNACEEINDGKQSRKKCDREKMKGVSCPCCEPYYSALGLSPKSKAQHINNVSRHRYVVPPPPTPPHYWEVDFPSSSECKRRGYTNISDKPYIRRHKRGSSRRLWWKQEKGEGANGNGAKDKKEENVGKDTKGT